MTNFPAHGVFRLARVGHSQQLEARRRHAVQIVFILYIMCLAEGPLRKWFLPGLSTPLIFFRDPVAFWLYAYCLQYGLITMRGILVQFWLIAIAITVLLSGIQYLYSDLSPAGWILGIRTYWLYFPLALVVAKVFRREDVQRLLLLNAVISIPYAALVATQYNAGPRAWVNLGAAGDDSSAVGLGDLIVRPFGLFTYTGPNVDFTAATVAMFFALLLSSAKSLLSRLLIPASGLAVCIMAVLTGSRGIYFIIGIIALLSILGSTLVRPELRTVLKNFSIVFFVLIAGAILVNVFPDMLLAIEARFDSAAQVEGSIWQRAFSGVTDAFEALETAPPLGYGLGSGASAVAAYLGLPPLAYGEADLQRNINEIGLLFGPLFVVLRFVTTVMLVRLAMGLASKGMLIALPLAGYAAVQVAYGAITNSPLNAFFPMLLIGFILALSREVQQNTRIVHHG